MGFGQARGTESILSRIHDLEFRFHRPFQHTLELGREDSLIASEYCPEIAPKHLWQTVSLTSGNPSPRINLPESKGNDFHQFRGLGFSLREKKLPEFFGDPAGEFDGASELSRNQSLDGPSRQRRWNSGSSCRDTRSGSREIQSIFVQPAFMAFFSISSASAGFWSRA